VDFPLALRGSRTDGTAVVVSTTGVVGVVMVLLIAVAENLDLSASVVAELGPVRQSGVRVVVLTEIVVAGTGVMVTDVGNAER